MYFTSFGFILFLVVTFVLYYAVPKKAQWPVLLAASLFFYAFSGLTNFAYIFATIISTYLIGVKLSKIHKEQSGFLSANKAELSKEQKKEYKAGMKKKRWRWLLVCLFLNFGIMAVIKYTDFAISNVNSLIETFGGNGGLGLMNLILPLGLSFYTFQTMGYIIDVYRGKCEAEQNIFKFALFTSFFPQIIQGPISRFEDISTDLFGEKSFDAKTFSYGAQRIIWGFLKKLVIADRLLIAVRVLSADPQGYPGIYVLACMFLYAVTLYADFTGGIDITIGIAEAMGIKVKENFDRPFYSKSIAEYWRRWHITMGTWFKDYLFYPLSVCKPMLNFSSWSRRVLGEKIGKRLPVYVSTLVVWFATGLWHGATWNFIVWGLVNGVVILISQEFNPLYAKFGERFSFVQKRGYEAFRIFRTFWLMCFIRAFDCYEGVAGTFKAQLSVFTDFSLGRFMSEGLTGMGLGINDYIAAFLAVGLLLIVSVIKTKGSARDFIAGKPAAVRHFVFAALILAILIFGVYGVGYDSRQFIYNKF